VGSDKSFAIRLRLNTFIPIPTDDVARMTFHKWTINKIYLFMNILNKCQQKGYCWASKQTLADECHITRWSVTMFIKEYINAGLLKFGEWKYRVHTLVPTQKSLDRFFE
jgi:hypothetical protein